MKRIRDWWEQQSIRWNGDTIATDDVDGVSRFEKFAIGLNVLSSALNVARWYAGTGIVEQTIGTSTLNWIIILFAIAAGLSMDVAVIVTMLQSRKGRRGLWSYATMLAATVFSSLIALDLHGGFLFGAYLHVANAVMVFFLVMHLSQPKRAPRSLYVPKTQYDADLRQLVTSQANEASLTIELDQVRRALKDTEANLAKMQTVTRHAPVTRDDVLNLLAHGEWSWRELIQDIVRVAGSKNKAAHALHTSVQNISNWLKE